MLIEHLLVAAFFFFGLGGREFSNAFLEENVEALLLVGDLSGEKHKAHEGDSAEEDDDAVFCVSLRVPDAKLEAAPPVEGLEGVEEQEYTDDLKVVQRSVLVNALVVAFVNLEVAVAHLGSVGSHGGVSH